MKTAIIIIIIITLFFLISCDNHESKVEKLNYDTLVTDSKTDNIKCLKSTKGFKNRFGIVLPKYFVVNNYISIDVNKDGKQDTIAVLTPSSFIPENVRKLCDTINVENRLLVKFININNVKSKIEIYPKIISNEISTAWGGYEKLKKINHNAFVLNGDRGQGCKFKYSIYMSVNSGKIYADSINFLSFCPNGSNNKTKTFIFKNRQPIKKFDRKIIDSLKLVYDM